MGFPRERNMIMKRFTSYLLACMVGAFGLYGCGGAEDAAMEEAATEEMAMDVAMINVEVSSISEEFANINTNATSDQLMEAGFAADGWISVTHNEQTLVMPMVTDYGDVAEGAWLARFDEESGTLQIAINGGNAATDIGAAVGDMLHVMAADAPEMDEGEMGEGEMGEGEMGEGEMDEGEGGMDDEGAEDGDSDASMGGEEEATTQPAQ
ncbi:MAG: SAM-dependent chlorinase/fluorinase [Gemmatimonadetes bacterium]|nr:SAM-dependent chlorinase/fluorinase [Gemmatimonadota bacterium]MYA77247.1 SAM-dependent chlorinase/fluorinase [Gemmatimonadota bacterium]MYG17854.1 SAM-dependent chlorinase/fluorinase [Gemmatimonadota bacterium]MYH20131.1 SAM-dependent chlorinase/fluorinase [Gemmatimonadota bacterium]MYK98649.1 SAM-dependent chlorinase/fluorinase [Gemmatimonadota bacterium]